MKTLFSQFQKQVKALGILLFFVILSTPAFAQHGMSANDRKEVVEGIAELIDSIYVFPDVAGRATDYLKEQERQGEYDEIIDPNEFAQVLTEDLRSISHDLHLNVSYDPKAIAREKEKPAQVDKGMGTIEMLKKENFGFKEVSILEGNVGYIDLRLFVTPEVGAETAVAAMNYLANTDAIIFDLRNNRGGSPAMIQLILSYLYESEPVHINNFYFRPTDEHTQTWTLPYVPGKRNPGVDVYVLTSQRSFSAAEEFSFDIKNLERGTLIGETTGGAANPGRTHTIDDRFTIFIPSGRAYSPVTGENWEGTGVEPHIEVPEEDALQVAHSHALQQLKNKTENVELQEYYDWHINYFDAAQAPVELSEEELTSLCGSYGPVKIEKKDDQLIYHKRGAKLKLIPISKTEFYINDQPRVRLKFSEDRSELKEEYIPANYRIYRRS
ncbi:S41 family peptidase [Salinimicrobium sp. HB62]|uniref:S41 family peptidase n=1 Tax=Salinimicrobium sp. HB62 TaxID=3077781 RepID=UPI002D79421A|nr:S41 family peptidase [Salinimicrobium sp. HB62]